MSAAVCPDQASEDPEGGATAPSNVPHLLQRQAGPVGVAGDDNGGLEVAEGSHGLEGGGVLDKVDDVVGDACLSSAQ